MLKTLQKVFSHHSTTRCSFIIGRSGAVMQILAGSAANCQKIRNLELPNPNPTPFGRPDNACKCTKLYIPLQNILMGCLFFHKSKVVCNLEMSKHIWISFLGHIFPCRNHTILEWIASKLRMWKDTSEQFPLISGPAKDPEHFPKWDV